MTPADEPVDSDWLGTFLTRSLASKWCTRIYCTTCGARDFRQGLRDALTAATGKAPPPIRFATYSTAEVEFVAGALATLVRDNFAIPEGQPTDEGAMRMILHELESSVGATVMQQRIAPLLAGTWAGGTLDGMYLIEAWRREARRVHEEFNAPEAVTKRRDESKRLKAEAHAARLEAKKERDRLWRERNPGG